MLLAGGQSASRPGRVRGLGRCVVGGCDWFIGPCGGIYDPGTDVGSRWQVGGCIVAR